MARELSVKLNTSCALDRCLARVHDMIDWDNKYPVPGHWKRRIRAVGMGRQCRVGITSMDRRQCDATRSTMRAFTRCINGGLTWARAVIPRLRRSRQRCLSVRLTNIYPRLSADTDWAPYDSGSYASSTTYVTGKATEKCAHELRGKICALGAKLLGCDKEQVSFDGREVRVEEGENAGKTLA